MSTLRTTRFALLFMPLMLLLLALVLPHYSARVSLLLHGLPFARVVPKEKVDIFRYVQMDGFDKQAVVFSRGKAVGLIVQPLGSPAYFESLSEANSAQWSPPFTFLMLVVTARFWGWLVLPAQAIILLVWLRNRGKQAASFVYDV